MLRILILFISIFYSTNPALAQVATTISYIRWISPSECERMKDEAERLVIEEKSSVFDFYGSPTRLIKVAAARSAVDMLCASSNLHFPPEPLTGIELTNFLAKKQHRGVLQVAPGKLTCDTDGRVAGYKKGQTFNTPGYTPVAVRTAMGQPTLFFERAERGRASDSLEYSAGCVLRKVTARSRIRMMPGGLTSKVALLNFPPWISRTIWIEQCCNEPVKFKFGGSHFPSHRSYIGASAYKKWKQTGFTEFLMTKGGSDARKVTF